MLRLDNLSKNFNGITAVDGLSLEIERGELFGLLGPNGAGKTTTVNVAVGLLEPDAGAVELEGFGSPKKPETRRLIGVAPQALAIYEELTAEENLLFFGKIEGITGSRLRERVDWALDFVGLQERRKSRVDTFSGGMKRRLNLAVALVHDPPLLLLDEPTVGVDPQSRNSIFENIQTLQKEGRTIVYTTHYMEEAQRLCDRVGIIDRGKLLALDTVDGLLRQYGGKTVVSGETAEGQFRVETDDPMAELKRRHESGELLRFQVEGADLESVFLRLTGRHLRD